MALDFGNKVQNMGATAQGRLTAAEFNAIVQLINEHEELLHKKWVGSESEYESLVQNNQIHDDWLYYIYEDDEQGGDEPQESGQSVSVEGDMIEVRGVELSQDGEMLTIHGSISQDGETLVLNGTASVQNQQHVEVDDEGQIATIRGALLSQDGETLELRGLISGDTFIIANN